jgi:pimeloyl-ACP methyl ester carboxylesterase
LAVIELVPMAGTPLHFGRLEGQSNLLVVSFSGVGTRRTEVPPPEFGRLASLGGAAHVLFVSDLSRSWMNGPKLAERIAATVRATADEIGAEEICAIGNSMGGTAAMVLAALMPVDRVLAITPQVSVRSDLVPEEKRWQYFRKKIADWPFAEVPDLRERETAVTILHGGMPDELVHALRFPGDAGYRHYIFPQLGHRLGRDLHDKGQLEPIVTNTLLGRFPRARVAVRTAGGTTRERFDRKRLAQSSKEAAE